MAGQVGINPDGTIPVSAKEQGERALERLAAILESLGLDFTDLVELVTYHTDVLGDLADFRAINERFISSDFPAWTIVDVASLARKELVIEIKAVASAKR